MINYGIIAGVIGIVGILVLWLIMRNRKDKEEFAKHLNEDFSKPKEEENEM